MRDRQPSGSPARLALSGFPRKLRNLPEGLWTILTLGGENSIKLLCWN
jgi:hypothetical protein